ncbi:MAG: TrkA C-terminal domain-containing protein [Herbinix sp.]|nr:TrkA C-terminal domain-containing protein [Herbinix sp.]
MNTNIVTPVYSQIALDIAMRVAAGELKENTKIYGRSIMASEYGVSPETIRRSMKLLEDMDIVELKQNSGALIISAENAKKYVDKFCEYNDIRNYQRKLKDLLDQQMLLSRQISEVAGAIIRINGKFTQSTPFPNYEVKVTGTSKLIGKTLVELKFWQQTSATIIAIRRGDKIILSPGPYAIIMENDTLIYVSDINRVETVTAFIEAGVIM